MQAAASTVSGPFLLLGPRNIEVSAGLCSGRKAVYAAAVGGSPDCGCLLGPHSIRISAQRGMSTCRAACGSPLWRVASDVVHLYLASAVWQDCYWLGCWTGAVMCACMAVNKHDPDMHVLCAS